MEENPFGPTGPQLYIVSERHLGPLRNARLMLDDMAYDVFNGAHHGKGNQPLVISRAQLNHFLACISALIGRVLDNVDEENGIAPVEEEEVLP
jgi:hypothetical protein